MKTRILFYLICTFLTDSGIRLLAQSSSEGWSFRTPRTALEPLAWRDKEVRYRGEATLAIGGQKLGHDQGSWVRRYPVTSAIFEYRAVFSQQNVEEIRRSIITTLIWLDENGKQIGAKEFPAFSGQVEEEWFEFRQIYKAPENAREMEVELTYRWDGDGKVWFAQPQITPQSSVSQKSVKLGTIHHKPKNSSTDGNRQVFGALARQAGAMDADIVCMPEALTMVGTGKNYFQCAEPLPGPSSEFLGAIAKEYQMYIVAGILEKEGDMIYNTAILLDRQGQLAGKYRKVCLPREEIEGGISPGKEFPVFETDFGKIGLMICWDVTFPEPAMKLAQQGAEVIFLPIAGGNLNLAEARAIENQIYLVSSAYDLDMRTGVFDLEGKLIAEGSDENPVVVVEVDLKKQKLWPWLGEYKNRIAQERPASNY